MEAPERGGHPHHPHPPPASPGLSSREGALEILSSGNFGVKSYS